MEIKNLTCIGCPMGCQVTVEFEGEEIFSVKGNSCAIGDKYARQEVTHPERTVTSTVVVVGGAKERTSVKTKGNIPKDKIFACMEEINKVLLACPAGLYHYENGKVTFSHEGCLECGTCRVLSIDKVVKSWDHPMGGAGVQFRQG